MRSCADFERLMEGLMAGEYEPQADGSLPRWAETARRELLAHARDCPACGELYQLHEWLCREAPGLEEPEPREFQAMRQSVLAGIRACDGVRDAGEPARLPWWQRLLLRPAVGPLPGPALRLRGPVLAAAAAGLLVAGVAVGRLALPAGPVPGGAAEPGPLAAAGDEVMRSLEGAPYLFSNVSVQPAGEGRVTVSLDLTKRVTLERSRQDPLVREALLHSLRGSSPLGDRLKAVSVAGGLMDPGIREALILAMEEDPAVAVRLRALETLGRYTADPLVQSAMLRVLTEEESVQMRLLAVDFLGSSQVQRERIRDALSGTRPDGAEAVLVRASERLGL